MKAITRWSKHKRYKQKEKEASLHERIIKKAWEEGGNFQKNEESKWNWKGEGKEGRLQNVKKKKKNIEKEVKEEDTEEGEKVGKR